MIADIVWFAFFLPVAFFGGLICVALMAVVFGSLVLFVAAATEGVVNGRPLPAKPRSDRHAVGE